MKINARKEAGIVNPSTGDYLELDIYLPSLQLAFEFQVSNPPLCSSKYLTHQRKGKATLPQGFCFHEYNTGRNSTSRYIETRTHKQEWNHIDHCSLLVGQTTRKVMSLPLPFESLTNQ